MKRLMCGLLLGMFCLPLGGCRGEEMERFFITTAMAIDWDDGQYSLKLEGSADEMDENRGPKAVLREGRGSNLTQCFLDIQKQTGEYPYTRQTELILLSGKIPSEPLRHLLDDLLNQNGVRLNARIAMTGGRAGDLLKEEEFASRHILQAMTKGGGTLTSADILLRDLAHARAEWGIDPVLPLTFADRTEGLCLLRGHTVAGQISSRLMPVFMMAGGTLRGGSITVEVGGEACAFKLLHNKGDIDVRWENGQAKATVKIEGEFRAANRLTDAPALYEAALRKRLEEDLLALVHTLQAADCDALGFGQQLARRHPMLWTEIGPHWAKHFAVCTVEPEIAVTITTTGKLKAE